MPQVMAAVVSLRPRVKPPALDARVPSKPLLHICHRRTHVLSRRIEEAVFYYYNIREQLFASIALPIINLPWFL
jgi:hypothetical protein